MKKTKPLNYDEWIALGPEAATQYLTEVFGLNEDRQRKLLLILQREWPEQQGKPKHEQRNIKNAR